MKDIEIVEKWTVVDRWWTPEPLRADYREVIWDGRIFILSRTHPEMIWRIVSANGPTTTSK